MMKRLCILLLALLLPLTSALAGSLALDDYAVPLPEGVAVEEGETTVTLVKDTTRVVVQAFPQDREEDGAAQILTLMTVYSPNVTDVAPLTLIPGVYGAKGYIKDCFGPGEDQLVVLILSDSGLLVLSAYDLGKDNARAESLLGELLKGTTLLDKSILTK